MSTHRTGGYTGEGRARRAIVVDDGPSSVRADPSNVGGEMVVGGTLPSETAEYKRAHTARTKARKKAAG